ncbi:hypothetical protein FKW77_010885 [Venturia effusa]|uniref:Peptidase A2 domain-containing protein n=1 Tax=Venturia effusa TaxID=50376 RepID=A0A517KYQ3_9PEZI|nr:hypothetical protein FKW77_010885 [Venturia effusa]
MNDSMTTKTVLTFSTGALALSAAFLWSSRHRLIREKDEDFIRVLEICSPLKCDPKRIKARLDTGADHSVISKDVVDSLGLQVVPLEEDDPSSVILPDESLFSFRGKITITFHVLDPAASQKSLFGFNKYEYKATFFIPADGDIASFDAYIGRDIITKHHLQSSSFFSNNGHKYSSGAQPVDKKNQKPKNAKQQAAWESQNKQERVQTAADYDRTMGNNAPREQQPFQGPPPRAQSPRSGDQQHQRSQSSGNDVLQSPTDASAAPRSRSSSGRRQTPTKPGEASKSSPASTNLQVPTLTGEASGTRPAATNQ